MQLRGEWMRKQILPSAPFVGVQGIIDYYELEVGQRRRRQRGRRVSVRHGGESKVKVIVGAVVGWAKGSGGLGGGNGSSGVLWGRNDTASCC